MNKLLICRLLGIIALLIGVAMTMSLPWAWPIFRQTDHFEAAGFFGLLGAMAICGLVGGVLMLIGRKAGGDRLLRREAIAVVGLGWLMATVLGAMPFWFSGACVGLNEDGTRRHMDVFDGLFESASGFSGTGATVLTNVENPELISRAVLFWRSETHFLGGLGIMVLFVAILGAGSAGKTLLLTEMPGPSHETTWSRSQRTAWTFAMIFIGLTAVLAILLRLQGVCWFDSLCQSFGTIATGGFSTYNNSVAHFHSVGVEMTITLFMILACTNFTLLFFLLIGQPGKLWKDVEFRAYVLIMFSAAVVVIVALQIDGHYTAWSNSARYGIFQVVSIMTNTGFGTADFNQWGSLNRAILFLLMFVGGCAGSTSCAVKVIRYVLFFKILGIEIERVYHPTVVRPLRLGERSLENPDIRKEVILYFAVIGLIFVIGWVALLAVEPDSTWVHADQPVGDKLIDCASAVAATLNGVGPGLGIVGESENYSHFHRASKFILTWLMLLGRLEVFVLLVLFVPRFWRGR